MSPVRAGQNTQIRFSYIQPTQIDTGIGRYVYPLEEGGVDEKKLAFWTNNDVVEEKFEFNLKLRSGYPISAVRVPDQGQANINQSGPGERDISLGSQGLNAQTNNEEQNNNALKTKSPKTTKAFTLDKDLVVYWRHQEGLPGSVDLVAYKPEGSDRGTFLPTVTPGDDLQKITKGRDWVIVLDTSGIIAR